jgi:hypothetical protein
MANGVIFEGEFVNGACESVGKLLYSNGDIYFGQHRAFVREGQGKMIYLNASVYEGGWENDRKNMKGRMFEKTLATFTAANTLMENEMEGEGCTTQNKKRFTTVNGPTINDKEKAT